MIGVDSPPGLRTWESKMATARPHSRRDQRRERETELRRADIIVAATAVFAEKGFQGAQVAEIANTAEVSLNAIYALYKSKEDLYEAVIDTVMSTVSERVQGQVRDIEDPGEKLLSVIDALFLCYDEHRDFLLLYSRTTHGLPWRVRQSLGNDSVEIIQSFRNWLIGVAHDAKRAGRLGELDPETVALSIIGAVMTTAARWIELPHDESLVAAAPRVRALFETILASAPPSTPS